MDLKELTAMSNRYGQNPDYVLAGGGNTSVKDDTTLYVKCSGTCLADITEDGFVAMDEILPQYENSFLTFLRTAHKQHTAGLTSARTAEDITITVGVYQELLAELEQFTSTFHRSPRWNSNEDERRLYNKVLMLITYNQVNQFKQVLPYISQIKNLLNKYPSIGLTTYETLEKLRTFIEETGHFPRQISEAKPGEVIPEEELHLYECMVYWSTVNKNFATKITELHIIAPLL